MIPAREILEQIWATQLAYLSESSPAVKFQRSYKGLVTEYRVCKRCVYIDYAPKEQLDPTKLYPYEGRPLLSTVDETRVHPDNFLQYEFLELNDAALLTNWFLPFKDDNHAGMYALDLNKKGEYCKRMTLDATKDGPFRLVALSLYSVPAWCKEAIYGRSSIVALHGQLGLTKPANVPTLLLSSESSTLIITLTRTGKDEDPTIILEGDEKLHFDGLIEATASFARLVPRKEKSKMPAKGLANPVHRSMGLPKAAAPVEPPAPVQEPAPAEEQLPDPPASIPAEEIEVPTAEEQVEEVQPEQSEQIAQAAPEVPKVTRSRKVKAATQDSNMLAMMEELSAYLGSPVPDTMSVSQLEEEMRHCRELGIALSRRLCNLGLAGTAASNKIVSSLRALVN